eukprot:TRINITY_DN3757_c0_g1_i1.p3 TRINITY_DN3757_c0_g1~~TRINITY_DN3757_c0_g1_i1.p3  ORF type:complete len:88 (-),score=15.59 TRINITY_DN3757_c0_g1_i1:702-965(-)
MFGIAIIASVAMTYLTFFRMKESPRWLVTKGREDEARPLIAEYLGEANVEEEINNIKNRCIKQKQVGARCSLGKCVNRFSLEFYLLS